MTQLISQLPSPYKELAEMRRAQCGRTADNVRNGINWLSAPEYDFWQKVVDSGQLSPIPEARLRELDAWLREQGKTVECEYMEDVIQLGVKGRLHKDPNDPLTFIFKKDESKARLSSVEFSRKYAPGLNPYNFERVDSDPTNPDHYKALPKEVIDIIEFTLTPEQFKGYLIGNAMKYRLRAGLKGDAAEDMAKARWYEERAKNL